MNPLEVYAYLVATLSACLLLPRYVLLIIGMLTQRREDRTPNDRALDQDADNCEQQQQGQREGSEQGQVVSVHAPRVSA